jgi:hypothetical protein
MATVTGSGISGQVGLVAEPSWGSSTTVTRFYEVLSENIQLEVERTESAGIRSGQRVMRSDDWVGGNRKVSGPIEFELSTRNMALLLEHSLGTVTSMAGPTPGTLSPADLTGKGLSVQVGRPDVAGTVVPYTFNGGKVASWELSASVGEVAKLTLDMVFKDQTTATALAAASYTSGLGLFTFVHGAVTIGGNAVPVRNISLKGDNALDTERFFLGGSLISEPIEAGRRDYSFDLEADHSGTVIPGRIDGNTEAALVLTFTSGGSIVKFTTNARFDAGYANLSGMEILAQPLSGKLIATAADSTALLVHVTSGETAP